MKTLDLFSFFFLTAQILMSVVFLKFRYEYFEFFNGYTDFKIFKFLHGIVFSIDQFFYK